ncbi:hypothetical protein PV10_01259 [Exophiala mesophila]|uniref:CFEM domain-containing protein n=1 Tax=Exophiala mesophila TaxID=212818 RepID=A0A0D1ZSL1_EXOME|nr:uncharacterized protein PV10_01259 [Exophiala mesophila]KIV97512.1 hypothetical protein PV10_01259 [Exophiala mesophila]
MRQFHSWPALPAFVVLLLQICTLSCAQVNNEDLSALPECGQTCVQTALDSASKLGCQPTEEGAVKACLCGKADFHTSIWDCSSKFCSNTNETETVDAWLADYCLLSAGFYTANYTDSAGATIYYSTFETTYGYTATNGAGGITTETTTGLATTTSRSDSASSTDIGGAEEESSSGGLSTGAIAGIAVGVSLGVIAAIAALVFFIWRKRRANKQQVAADQAPGGPAEMAATNVAGQQKSELGGSQVGELSGSQSQAGTFSTSQTGELSGTTARHEMESRPSEFGYWQQPTRSELP